MRRHTVIALTGLAFIGLVLAATLLPARRPPVLRVGIAASLEPPLTDRDRLANRFRAADVEMAFASSGRLAAQLRAGAPYDVVVLAAGDLADELHAEGLIETPIDIASNRLVVAIPRENGARERAETASGRRSGSSGSDANGVARTEPGASAPASRAQPDAATGQSKQNALNAADGADGGVDWRDALARAERVAIGEPSTVPAGAYAEQALRHANLWDGLQGRLIYGANARQIADYLQRGEVDAAVLYESDAVNLAGVAIAHVFPEAAHDPIRYPAAVVTATPSADAAAAIVAWLASDEARALFAAHGFRAVGP